MGADAIARIMSVLVASIGVRYVVMGLMVTIAMLAHVLYLRIVNFEHVGLINKLFERGQHIIKKQL
ncbi:MAG: hypothetical protein QXQ48_06735 [Nitrososphaerota archaeon]